MNSTRGATRWRLVVTTQRNHGKLEGEWVKMTPVLEETAQIESPNIIKEP